MKLKVLLITSSLLLLTLVLVQSASAMASPNYRVDWLISLSGGGGPASSTNYMANFTIGQTSTGSAASTNYSTGWGYWSAVWNWILNLPLILK